MGLSAADIFHPVSARLANRRTLARVVGVLDVRWTNLCSFARTDSSIAAMSQDILVEHVDHWLVISFRARKLTDPQAVHHATDAMLRELSSLPLRGRVVLDFRKVELASSQVLGMMLAAKREVDRRCGELVLTRVGDSLRELLRMTRLESQFVFVERLRDVVGQRRREPALVGTGSRGDEPKWIDSVS